MSRRIYSDGVLVEEWDDAAAMYRRFDEGELVEERAYTSDEVAASAADSRQADRAALEQGARAAVADNDAALAVDGIVYAEATAIAVSEAVVLTSGQIVGVLKDLARGIAVLAEHDAQTKTQLNALIRLAVGSS